MPEAVVEVGGRPDPLVVRINGQSPTFTLKADAIDRHLFRDLTDRHLDLLEIAAAVFHADGSVSRGGATRTHMGQAWRRRFGFTFEVRDLGFWERTEVREALSGAIEFLTDDSVNVAFRKRTAPLPLQPYLPLATGGPTIQADRVILFSGGLDSFAGALETLASTTDRAVLLTHRSAQKAIPRQHELGLHLIGRFPGRVLHLEVMARRAGQEAKENSQRSRSFLFAALGHVVAHGFGASRVDFFENGIISHNLPLSSQIIGTMATRTTHPLALRRLSDLMDLVGPDRIPIRNNYAWNTKTDVVRRIAEQGGEDQIAHTVSCTSIREQNTRHTHCGACSQCLDRRFAILAAGLEQFDFAEDYAIEVLSGGREKLLAKTMALDWTRHAIALAEMSESSFMARFGHEIGRILQGHSGEDDQTTLRQTYDMHRRHGETVRGVLEQAIAAHSGDLARQALPETSLIRGWVGGLDLAHVDSSAAQPADEVGEGRKSEHGQFMDFVPDPEAPLHVRFLKDGARLSVSVEGLCRITGAPARVPHALKRTFDEDRADGRTATEHRFVHLPIVPALGELSPATLRQYVTRCRRLLSDSFREVHGRDPDAPLLIENRPSRGHRLDPTIVVVDSLD